MSTISQFFQPPLYWQQFEELTVGMLREVYNVANAQQFGRPGQAQQGVDVSGKSGRYGMIGIQCKRLADLDEKGNPYPGGPITRKFLREAATNRSHSRRRSHSGSLRLRLDAICGSKALSKSSTRTGNEMAITRSR